MQSLTGGNDRSSPTLLSLADPIGLRTSERATYAARAMRPIAVLLPVIGVAPLTRLGGSARNQRSQLPVETKHPHNTAYCTVSLRERQSFKRLSFVNAKTQGCDVHNMDDRFSFAS